MSQAFGQEASEEKLVVTPDNRVAKEGSTLNCDPLPPRFLTKAQSVSLASWVFGSFFVLFFILVFTFAPSQLPEFRLRILAYFSALLAGLAGYFLTGDIGLRFEASRQFANGDVKWEIKAAGGLALFVIVLYWWFSPIAPIGTKEEIQKLTETTQEIKRTTARVVVLLENALEIKNQPIDSFQVKFNGSSSTAPSARAQELAKQIPENAGPYPLALKAIAERRFDDARRQLECVQREKEVELAKVYKTWGEMDVYSGRYVDALSWYQKALNVRPDDPDLLLDTGRALFYACKYLEAEKLINRALVIRENLQGKDHRDVGLCLNDLAVLYQYQGRYHEAEMMFPGVLEITERSLRPDHPDVAVVLSNLAALFAAMKRTTEAEILCVRALAITRQSYGQDHPDVAIHLNNLAQLLQAQNRMKEAELLMREALAITERSFGPIHPEVAIRLNNLAQLLQATNRTVLAEPLLRRALLINERLLGSDHPDVAIRLNNLAQLFQATNRNSEAESLLRRALLIDERSLGPDHPEVAIRLNNLAQLLQATNRVVEAEPLLRRALAINESAHGPIHPEVARNLSNLAILLKATNRITEAELVLNRAIAINMRSHGLAHPDIALDFNNLAHLLKTTNRIEQAEPLMREALAINEHTYGPDHTELVTTLNNLAGLLWATKRLEDAELLMSRAVCVLSRFQKSTGYEHPLYQAILKNYYRMLTKKYSEEPMIAKRIKEVTERTDKLSPIVPALEQRLGRRKSAMEVVTSVIDQIKESSVPAKRVLDLHQPVSPFLNEMLKPNAASLIARGAVALDGDTHQQAIERIGRLPLDKEVTSLVDQILAPVKTTYEVFEALDRRHAEQRNSSIWSIHIEERITPKLDEILGPTKNFDESLRILDQQKHEEQNPNLRTLPLNQPFSPHLLELTDKNSLIKQKVK